MRFEFDPVNDDPEVVQAEAQQQTAVQLERIADALEGGEDVLLADGGQAARSTGGTERCWDHEDCPRDDCGGELQQQDRFNVMCLSCEEVFTHWKDGDCHRLLDEDDETVAKVARMVPDGGTARPDPSEDPRACSVCGVHIGFFGDDYCDGCAREIGVKPPLRRCTHCGQRGPEEQMKAIDVSPPEEYYPTFEYLCRGCAGGDADR